MGTRKRVWRVLRKIHRVIFYASREGRASEIAAWSNGLVAVGLGVGAFALGASWAVALVVAIVGFALLRAALTHRVTIWIAGVLGTLAVAVVAGGLAWLFGHVIEVPAAPVIAGAVVAAGSAVVPAWAYRRLARRRADNIPDSLLDPVSIPPSR